MDKYHKIQTVFKRDPETKHKSLIIGDYSLPEFEYLKDNEWIWTEKVDGTNIRICFETDRLVFRGKSNAAHVPFLLMNNLNDKYLPMLDRFKTMFNCPVCLYGEGYGIKIQKGGKYTTGNDFVLFDVKVGDIYLERENVEDIGRKLNTAVVPIIGKGTLKQMVEYTAKGFNSRWGDFIAERTVARPSFGLKAHNGDRIITKIKYKDFFSKNKKIGC